MYQIEIISEQNIIDGGENIFIFSFIFNFFRATQNNYQRSVSHWSHISVTDIRESGKKERKAKANSMSKCSGYPNVECE